MKDVRATVIVDLNGSEEEIKSRLHKDARWGIGRAERDGLKVEESELWNEFYEMYKTTLIEGGNDPKPLEFLKKTSDKLFVCKKDDKLVGGAVIKTKDLEFPKLRFNASLKDYQTFQPNNLLYWNCILWCKRQGYKKFDLGGWQISARGHLQGVNKFKEKWGKVVYIKEDYPFFKALFRKTVRKFYPAWWLNQKIKGRKITG